MPITQILRDGHVIIPKEFRKALGLNEGDFLDIRLRDDGIVFCPKPLIDKKEAKERLFALIDKARQKNKDVPFEEIQSLVKEAVQAARLRVYPKISAVRQSDL